ncbi:hypothetical protein KSC_023220 [Ktedonobacter sp. SOSP1-52]|nr:hypothetical protein KSC_023220 [Ktedonobacter sp. SOSP1-52]
MYGAINVYFQNAMSIMEKQGRKGNQAQNSEDEFACQCLSDVSPHDCGAAEGLGDQAGGVRP